MKGTMPGNRWWCAVLLAVVALHAFYVDGAGANCRTNLFSSANFFSEFRIKNWTTEEGLPQNTVLSLLQSSDGYLWIGTLDGLVRFDGRTFTLYDQQNTPAFRNHAITCLAEHPAGSLWIGTPGGLLLYSNHQFQSFPLRAPPLPVRSICSRKAGGIWLATESGVARFESSHAVFYTNYPGFKRAGMSVNVVREDEDGTLWVGDDGGLVRLLPQATEFEIVSCGRPDFGFSGGGVNNLVRDDEGGLWFANCEGLCCFRSGKVQLYPGKANGFQGRVNPMCYDAQTGLWISSELGELSRLHEGKFTHYSPGTGLSDDRVSCALLDRERNLWGGTRAGGLNLAQRRRMLTLTTRDGLAGNDVWSISQGPDDSVWIATAKGLSRFSHGSFKTFRVENPPPGVNADRCYRVLAAHTGTVWAACGLGLCQAGSDKLSLFSPFIGGQRSVLPSQSLYEDSSGALWVGCENLYLLKDSTWRLWAPRFDGPPDTEHVLPGKAVVGTLQDAGGDIWIGTKGGLCRFRGSLTDCFTRTNGLPADVARPALADRNGTVWFAADNGLIRFKQGTFFLISTHQGLFEDLAYNVLEDDFGWLWLNGNRGLQRLRKQDVNDVADGKTNWLQCLHYGTADGMLSAEGNGDGLPNSCKTRDGRLWFPTTKGVVVVDPRSLKNNDVPPPVVIEQVVANGEVVFGDGYDESKAQGPRSRVQSRESLTSYLRFGPGEARSLVIHYTASSFVSPELIRFQYRLEGHDPTWMGDNRNLRTAIYTDLRPGNYRFKVRAFNNNGVASKADAEFAFSLAPHFYETWTFYGLCAGSVFLVGGSLHRVRLSGLRRIKELEQLHALEQERSRIAQDMHDSLGADLSRIAMLAEMVQRQGASGTIPQTQLERVSGLARSLVHGIGELVWATNPRNNSLDSLAAYIREYASELLQSVGVHATFEFPETTSITSLSGETRRHLFLAVKEVLNNVAKHAAASEVIVRLAPSDADVSLTIRDNGKGFRLNGAPKTNGSHHGNGLRNLQDRLASIGGRADIRSEPGSGTTVQLRVPLRAEENHAAL
jgi:ligand-binding sensor domain-containing protein/signal transduction histidine kinase